ncbi:Collagen alpha-1(XXVI) chain, partial [Lamprotornis superbus]
RSPALENNLPITGTTASWYEELLPGAFPLLNPGSVLRKAVGSDRLVPRAQLDPLGCQDHQGQKERRDNLVRGALQGHQECWDLKDQEDFQEKPGSQVPQVLQGHQPPQASLSPSSKGFSTHSSPQLKRKGHQVLQDPKGPQDPLEPLDHKACQDLQDSLDQKDPKETEEREVNQARRVRKVTKGEGVQQLREALKILAERVLILEHMIGIHDSLSSIEPGSGQDVIPGSPLRSSIKIKRGGPRQPQAQQILSSLLDEGEARRRSHRMK